MKEITIGKIIGSIISIIFILFIVWLGTPSYENIKPKPPQKIEVKIDTIYIKN